MLNFFNSTTAIGINISINNDLVIDVCSITVKGKQLEFQDKLTGLKTVDELKKYFKPGQLIAINITGKGVLIKKVPKLEEVTSANLLQILPNANYSDFYIQNFKTGETSFISLIRKTEVDNLIDLLKNAGFTTVILSLGAFVATSVLPQLNIYDNDIVFDGHNIKLADNREWQSYQYKQGGNAPFVLKIENEKLDEKLVLPYATAFQLVMGRRLKQVKANVDSVDEARVAAFSAKRSKSAVFVIVAVFFLVLLVNFLVFSWYQGANAQLAGKVSNYQITNNKLTDIEKNIAGKEVRLTQLGWDGTINKAKLIDELAATLPTEITWNYLAINPPRLNSTFASRHMRITGYSPHLLSVNEWMARTKLLQWVKSIQLESYSFNTQLATGQFAIDITY